MNDHVFLSNAMADHLYTVVAWGVGIGATAFVGLFLWTYRRN